MALPESIPGEDRGDFGDGVSAGSVKVREAPEYLDRNPSELDVQSDTHDVRDRGLGAVAANGEPRGRVHDPHAALGAAHDDMNERRRMSIGGLGASHASAGFTLLEMMLVARHLRHDRRRWSTAPSTSATARWSSGEREADINQRMRLAEEHARTAGALRGLLLRARDDEDQFPFFVGRADGMTFVTTAPQSRGGTGLAVSRIA